MIDADDCEAISGMNKWQGKAKYSEKACPSAALSTTDPRAPDLGSNTGRHDVKPVTNRLSYSTAVRQIPQRLKIHALFPDCLLFVQCNVLHIFVKAINMKKVWQKEFSLSLYVLSTHVTL
jgi:hypothetical protein